MYHIFDTFQILVIRIISAFEACFIITGKQGQYNGILDFSCLCLCRRHPQN